MTSELKGLETNMSPGRFFVLFCFYLNFFVNFQKDGFFVEPQGAGSPPGHPGDGHG